ncbi:MAG: protein kinase, partial [Candidatus Zixiibacteriota bacterium]
MSTAVSEPKSVQFGDYVLTAKIGQGGAAEIYRGRQQSLDRDVAIKILSPGLCSDPDIVRRFERESLVIARLTHPNIVHVIDKGVISGRYYFVMEFVDGASLREVIECKGIQLETKLGMFVDVCKALDYAHKNGVIHRDIKPSNILIDRQGNPRVADFGIAQIICLPETDMTESDLIMGTLSYMSPEQKVSSTNVDHLTDIYAMGVILYEMLTLKKPLGHFKLPSELNPEVDPRFDEIVLKCLAQEPKDRFQSAVQLKDAVLEVLHSRHSSVSNNKNCDVGTDSFVGKCRHLDTIKKTNFSSTILVENRLTRKLYVIKKHRRGDAGRKEATLLASLRHPHVVSIHGAGGDHSSTVIVSEYMPGGSLADRMARRYNRQQAMEIIIPAAKALDFAHKNNIIHGNLRPSNILFDGEETVKLTDFGLPPHYQGSSLKNWYGPPEKRKSRAGDLYSLGVILFQMLTGRIP